MSRFRILVESLVKSIYAEGLDKDAARLIALYEDAITDHYTGGDKTPAVGFTEYLDKRVQEETVDGHEIKIKYYDHSSNGKSFYVSAYVEVPVVDGFDPMPVELIYRSADHSKKDNKTDEKNYKNIDVCAPHPLFAKGNAAYKYTTNPNTPSDIPKFFIMTQRDKKSKEILVNNKPEYADVAIEQIKNILGTRIKEYKAAFNKITDKNQLPVEIFYNKETHPLLVDWMYRYKKWEQAKKKAAELEKDAQEKAVQDKKPEEKHVPTQPILSLNSFKKQ